MQIGQVVAIIQFIVKATKRCYAKVTTEETIGFGLTQSCKHISMSRSAVMIIIALSSLGTFLQPSAQMSTSVDCSDPSKQPYDFGPLTRDEKISVVGNRFSSEVSRIEKCTTKNEENSATDSDNLKTANDGNPDQKNKLTDTLNRKSGQSSASARVDGQTSISSNTIENDEKSVAFSKDGNQISDTSLSDGFDSSIKINLTAPPDPNGKQHEQLESSDNLRILKEQIKAKAEIETDPAVRKELLKKYEEL